MNGILIVLLLVAIAACGYVYSSSSVATGASGGVTILANSASAIQPPVVVPALSGAVVVPSNTLPTVPYTAAAVVPPVLPKLVKYIVLKKVMADEPVEGNRSFQVAEVKVFTNAGQLDSSAFSDASYLTGLGKQAAGQGDYPARNIIDGDLNTFTETGGTETNGPVDVHGLILTLKDPVKITRIEVCNRASYMPERLRGTIVTLASDLNTDPIWKSEPLTSATSVQVLNPQYSEGFSSIRRMFGM